MNLNCQINYDSSGNISSITSPDGGVSTLYTQLRIKYGNEVATDLMYIAYSDDAMNTLQDNLTNKGEPTMESLEKYIEVINKEVQGELTLQDKEDIERLSIQLNAETPMELKNTLKEYIEGGTVRFLEDMTPIRAQQLVDRIDNTEEAPTTLENNDSLILQDGEVQNLFDIIEQKSVEIKTREEFDDLVREVASDNFLARYNEVELNATPLPVHVRTDGTTKEPSERRKEDVINRIRTTAEKRKIKDRLEKEGTFMLAPNGQPSNLTEDQYLSVRTEAFIEWFGDWQNIPQNASKVLDENGEPKVLYHGSPQIFDTFNPNISYEQVFHFGELPAARGFARRTPQATIMPVFLNIRNIVRTGDEYAMGKRVSQEELTQMAEEYKEFGNEALLDGDNEAFLEDFEKRYADFLQEMADETGLQGDELINNLQERYNNLKGVEVESIPWDESRPIDGAIYTNLVEYMGVDSYVVVDPSNIKSAQDNIGTYSSESQNIRRQQGVQEGTNLGNRQPIEIVVEQLQRTGLAEEVNIVSPKNIKEFLDSNSDVRTIPNGFVVQNRIYLNSETATVETGIHEFAHLYNSALKKSSPKIYNRGIELVKEELNRGIESEIRDVIDFVKENQPALQGEALHEEILAELTGRRGVELITDRSKKDSSIVKWLKEALESIKELLGLSGMNNSQVMDLTLGEYIEAIAVDLIKGETPQETTQYSTFITPATVRSFSEETNRLKRLTDEYSEVASEIAKGNLEREGRFKELQNEILGKYQQELTDKVRDIRGVEVSFNSPYIGSWEGNYEPSLNMTLGIKNNADTGKLSALLFDMAETTSQDAFIIETESEYLGRIPLTEFDDNGYTHYPQMRVTFSGELSVQDKSEIAQMLNKSQINEFSIDGDFFIVSLLDFSDNQKQKELNFEQKRNTITTLFQGESRENREVNVRDIQINIRKSKYVGARNEGDEQSQTRSYDRSDLFKEEVVVTNDKDGGIRFRRDNIRELEIALKEYYEDPTILEDVIEFRSSPVSLDTYIVTDAQVAEEIHENYEKAISRTSDYVGNLYGHILSGHGRVFSPFKEGGDMSSIVGFHLEDIFIVSHFAPTSIRKGVELIDELNYSPYPVLLAVLDSQANMLDKVGFSKIAEVPQFFAGEIVTKNVMVNDSFSSDHMEKTLEFFNRARYSRGKSEISVLDTHILPTKTLGDIMYEEHSKKAIIREYTSDLQPKQKPNILNQLLETVDTTNQTELLTIVEKYLNGEQDIETVIEEAGKIGVDLTNVEMSTDIEYFMESLKYSLQEPNTDTLQELQSTVEEVQEVYREQVEGIEGDHTELLKFPYNVNQEEVFKEFSAVHIGNNLYMQVQELGDNPATIANELYIEMLRGNEIGIPSTIFNNRGRPMTDEQLLNYLEKTNQTEVETKISEYYNSLGIDSEQRQIRYYQNLLGEVPTQSPSRIVNKPNENPTAIKDVINNKVREYLKDSVEYKNLYSQITVTEEGLTLNRDADIRKALEVIEKLPTTELETLMDAIDQSRNIKVKELYQERPLPIDMNDLVVQAQNNPMSIEEFTGVHTTDHNGRVVTRDNGENIIRIKDELYLKINDNGTLSTYKKIDVFREGEIVNERVLDNIPDTIVPVNLEPQVENTTNIENQKNKINERECQ